MQMVLITPVPLSCYLMQMLTNMIILPSRNSTERMSKYQCKNIISHNRTLIMLLLIFGNVHPHHGPLSSTNILPHYTQNFDKFCSRKNLGFLHVNTRSLISKLDQLKLWVESTIPDVLVITETWLKKTIDDSSIIISGYNIFCQDRLSKGGGVAIFVKDYLQCSKILSKSILKQFELLILKIKLANGSVTVAGCYCSG